MELNKTEFVRSAAAADGFIRDGRPQIAFAGRSNVGKSSVISCLVRRKNFARAGSAPGKTVHINYFLADSRVYLTDLPGYGYAKASKSERARWAKLMEDYFASGLVSAGVLIVDSRHAPTADDAMMAKFFRDSGRPFVTVANKTDKLKKSETEAALAAVRAGLGLGEDDPLIPFSAESGAGRGVLAAAIEKLAGL